MDKKAIVPGAVYSTEEAAQLLGLNVLTVQKYVREKRIQAALIGGKWYRITGTALLKFLEDSETFRLAPCSWKPRGEEYWVARIDVTQDFGAAVVVRNWEWKDRKFSSKAAADHFARIEAKKRLYDIRQFESNVFPE